MTDPIDPLIQQLQHQIWTQFVPFGLLTVVGSVLIRIGVEKMVLSLIRLFRPEPAKVETRGGRNAVPWHPDHRPMRKRKVRSCEHRAVSYWGTGFPNDRGTRRAQRRLSGSM